MDPLNDARAIPLRQGSIYWLDKCSSLDGNNAKTRPVVIVSPPSLLKKGGPVAVVGCTASAFESSQTRIELPNTRDIPMTKSGLPKPCWLIPEWLLVVDRSRLIDEKYSGYLTGAKLKEVLAAVVQSGERK